MLSRGVFFEGVKASPRVVWAAESSPVSAQELASEIQSRLKRVPEFEFIREQAQKLGVRAWLFGGTAAGYSHYVNWDLKREKGDARFQKDRFDYDYTNIFRSTQDLDIVVDGNAEQIEALQKALSEKYPHFLGGKEQWEVRALKQTVGTKEALLGNPDYLNQHTDSNSTGMVEITTPKAGESVVRDLRDWESKSPIFLKDVHEGKLHYYFSPTHGATKRFKEGLNPPILSAIRYLTKAFQYQLEMRPEDLERIKKVIAQFDPIGSEIKNSYVAHWIEKNGKKLIQNAVNIEFAVETMDRLGLRDKLKKIKGDSATQYSLAWWMNKEPLRAQVVGRGKGKTAAEVFAANGWSKPGEPLIVSHETGNFLAYESITRAHTGDPNVLISRDGFAGEAARYGNGFYARVGQKGGRDTGFTIRFTLDPKAREGEDFTYQGDYLVIRNKAAVQVIPESLNWGPIEYFNYLAKNQELDPSEIGLLEKVKRRTLIRVHDMSDSEYERIAEVVDQSFSKRPYRWEALKDWFSLPRSEEFSRMTIERLSRTGSNDPEILKFLEAYPHWAKSPALKEALARKESYSKLTLEELKKRLSDSSKALTVEDRSYFSTLISANALSHDEVVPILRRPGIDEGALYHFLSVSMGSYRYLSGDPMEAVMNRISQDFRTSEDLVTAAIKTMSGSSEDIIKNGTKNSIKRLVDILSEPYAQAWHAAQAKVIGRLLTEADLDDFLVRVLKGDTDSQEVAVELIERVGWSKSLPHRFENMILPLLSKPGAKNWFEAQVEAVDVIQSHSNLARKLIDTVFSKNPPSPEVVEKLIFLSFHYSHSYKIDAHGAIVSLLAAQPNTADWLSVKKEYLALHRAGDTNHKLFLKYLPPEHRPHFKILLRQVEGEAVMIGGPTLGVGCVKSAFQRLLDPLKRLIQR